jgi:hypothetical protein
MTNTLTVELRNETLHGEVTDMDAFIFAGFIMPDFDTAIEQEKGLLESFQKFSTEHASMMAIVEKDQKQALASQLAQEWGERLMIRLSINLRLRGVFTQRIREVFPALSRKLVDHQRWLDSDGNMHEESKLRLDLTEVMLLINPIIGTLQEKPELAVPKPQPASTPISPVELVEPEPEDEVTRLKRELAQAQTKLMSNGDLPAIVNSPAIAP